METKQSSVPSSPEIRKYRNYTVRAAKRKTTFDCCLMHASFETHSIYFDHAIGTKEIQGFFDFCDRH